MLLGPLGASTDDDRFDFVPLYEDGRVAVLSAAVDLVDADAVSVSDLLSGRPFAMTGVPQAALDHFMLGSYCNGEGPKEDLSVPGDIANALLNVAHKKSFFTVSTATERFYRHPGVVFRPVARRASDPNGCLRGAAGRRPRGRRKQPSVHRNGAGRRPVAHRAPAGSNSACCL